MNWGKLDVIRQTVARVNINILGIRELKWTGMGEFNSDDHYINYYGQKKSLRRNGVTLIVNRRVQNSVLGCNRKNHRMISVHFQSKPFNISVIQIYAPNTDAKKIKLTVLWRLIRPSKTNTKKKKKSPFHHRGWNEKFGSQELLE